MKLIISTFTALLFSGVFLSAQMPGMVTMQQASASQGTTLGANTTSGAAGIALGNRVVMRGFVDFQYDNTDLEVAGNHDKRFRTGADVDFLFDFSPVTSEVHFNADQDGVSLEQAFIRYSLNRDFNFSFGRQVTVLGYESDEAPNLHQVSHAYLADVAIEDLAAGSSGRDAMNSFVGLNQLTMFHTVTMAKLLTSPLLQDITTANPILPADNNPTAISIPQLRRNYVDGIRANFNNGKFGLSLGLHNGLFESDHLNDSQIGIDIAASLMIVPGLEWRMGYAFENNDAWDNSIANYNTWATTHNSAITLLNTGTTLGIIPNADKISQFNTNLSYQTGGLTLAFEWDVWDIYIIDMWNIMLMGNYQFNNVFGLTLRYSHEDLEDELGGNGETDRFTIAPSFAITENLKFLFEYSHSNVESTYARETSVDEVYVQTLFNF
jgi:hypothetical protein